MARSRAQLDIIVATGTLAERCVPPFPYIISSTKRRRFADSDRLNSECPYRFCVRSSLSGGRADESEEIHDTHPIPHLSKCETDMRSSRKIEWN